MDHRWIWYKAVLSWSHVLLRWNMWFIPLREHNSPLTAKEKNNSWGHQNAAVLHVVWNVIFGVASLVRVLLYFLKGCFSMLVFIYARALLSGPSQGLSFLLAVVLLVVSVKAPSFFWNSDSAGANGKQPWWVDLPTAGLCHHTGSIGISVKRFRRTEPCLSHSKNVF